MSERQDDATLDAVADKVRKLLALSKSSNPHEAALAASRAQEIMFKYKLDMSRVEGTAKGVVGTKDVQIAEKKGHRNQNWRIQMLDAICKTNFCRVVIIGKGADRYVTLIGRTEDIQVVEYLHTYLSRTVDSLARAFYQDWKASNPDGHLDPFRSYLSFCNGATTTIAQRLYEQRKKDEQSAGEESTALVRREDGLVVNKMREVFPRLTSHKATQNSRSSDAFGSGMQAGRSISLNKSVGSAGERKGLK